MNHLNVLESYYQKVFDKEFSLSIGIFSNVFLTVFNFLNVGFNLLKTDCWNSSN